MRHWLLKTEPDTFGIADLDAAPRKTTSWQGVRNYQARNMLRDDFARGDLAFLYHSSCAEPGIVGIVEVSRAGYADASAWDRKSEYYDAKSPENKPVWYTVDVRLKRRLKHAITLTTLRERSAKELAGFALLRTGNRLSVLPVDEKHWDFIIGLE
jgi:predicted RNA-binding protein with PUA-like domain